MERKKMKRCARLCVLVALIGAFQISPLRAGIVPTSIDVNYTRQTMGAGEGYLVYHRSFTPLGEERTGWTDVRHPAYTTVGTGSLNILTKDNRIGFDRSDHSVRVQNVVVTDANGLQAQPNISSDFNFANEIYAQLGISVLNAGNIAATYNTVTSPIDSAEFGTIRGANRAADPVVNNYYIPDFDAAVGAVGLTLSPEDAATHGFGVVDPANGARNDTWAHELGHFLVDANRYNNGNGIHAPSANNLMATGGGNFRNFPGVAPKSAGNSAPKESGRPNGTLGGKDLFTDMMTPVASFPGGPFNTKQSAAIFGPQSNAVQYVARNHNLNASDRADFDWSEDNNGLELEGGLADQHPGPIEWMTFEIGATVASDQTGKDKGNWGSLALPDFAGPRFNQVDVVSQIARYADMDVDGLGNWSERESALDYVLQFSGDGSNWFDGIPMIDFIQGWTTLSDAENYITRWLSPVDATLVRVAGTGFNGGDANAQIDAIIAAVPEPASAMLMMVAPLALMRRRRSH